MSRRPSGEGRRLRQQDYKPSSVSRFKRAKPVEARRRPSIWDCDYSQPRASNPRAGRAAYSSPIWSCSGWGLPSRPVTRPLVRSYRTVSPLPLRCRKGGLSLWHYPSRRRAWALPSTLPFGARTFLPRILQGGRPSSCRSNSTKPDRVGDPSTPQAAQFGVDLDSNI